MPNIWSKILMPDWSVPYNCYEVGHTWTPLCTEAALDVGLTVFKESIKLYSPLYLLSLGLRKKYDIKGFFETFRSIARSSIFLSFNAFSVILLFCIIRRLMGKFYYSMCAYTPAFVGSLLAIMIERPSRRPALALYVTNIATETLFRIFVSRGYFAPINRGEVIIFTITMSILLYLVKKNGYGSDPVSLSLKFIIGKQESKPKQIKSTNKRKYFIQTNFLNSQHILRAFSQNKFVTFMVSLYTKFDSLFAKHRSCPHNEMSCVTYATTAFIRSFLLGWFGRTAIQTFSKPKLFFSKFSLLFSNLINKRNINFGLFLGFFTLIFKSVNCGLRWACNGSHEWHALISGLFAGPTMLLSPNTSITLYLMWKCIESLYCIGVKNGNFPFVSTTIHIIYALSTAQLFYAAVLEPKHMKPSYLKFLDRMTDHRFHLINRLVLDIFGTNSSAGYESDFPDLDLQYMTKRYQESVFMWLL